MREVESLIEESKKAIADDSSSSLSDEESEDGNENY